MNATSVQAQSTAGQLTDAALSVLKMRGLTVWRQNNIAVRGRKFTGIKGMPDIIGYRFDGRAVFCEVKTAGDRLSKEQIDFMDKAHAAGCIVYVINGKNNQLQNWGDFRMINDTGANP
jgi:hypothetical protein